MRYQHFSFPGLAIIERASAIKVELTAGCSGRVEVQDDYGCFVLALLHISHANQSALCGQRWAVGKIGLGS